MLQKGKQKNIKAGYHHKSEEAPNNDKQLCTEYVMSRVYSTRYYKTDRQTKCQHTNYSNLNLNLNSSVKRLKSAGTAGCCCC